MKEKCKLSLLAAICGKYAQTNKFDAMLASVSYNLDTLARYELEQMDALCKEHGLTKSDAVKICAALELGARRVSDIPVSEYIKSPKDIYNRMYPKMMNLAHEESYILLTNNANKVIKTMQLSKGGITSSIVDVRIVMKQILMASACAIAIVHNHPSGSLKPSHGDIDVTRKIKYACKTCDIKLLDHVIIGNGEYYSFCDNDML